MADTLTEGLASNSQVLPPVIVESHERSTLTVGTLDELMRPEGLQVTARPESVVALVPDLPRSTLLSGPQQATTVANGSPVGFEGAEHTFIGDTATLHFDSGDAPAGKTPLRLPNGLQLTYGQIVALGGDFFGLEDEPISDDNNPPSRFLAAFATLAQTSAAQSDAQAILDIMQREIAAVNQAIKNGAQPSTAYEALGDSLSKAWNRATGGGSIVSPWLPKGRYLNLATTNWDHFGTHAVTAYSTGHKAAMATAIAAKQATDPLVRQTRLQLAYAQNAFADHFLTDLFSSGHLRTPRKELHEQLSISWVGDLLSRYMHDEDCCRGLTVGNANGKYWTAYGDKRFFDTPNATNAQYVEQALQLSVDEVFAAYSTQTAATDLQALHWTPDIAKVSDWTAAGNPSPLFINNSGTIQRRTDVGNRYDYTWTEEWNGPTTLDLLSSLPDFSGCGDKYIPFSADQGVLQLWDNDGQLGMILYGPTSGGSFGVLWGTQDIGTSSAAVAWLKGDWKAAGKTDIFRISDSSGIPNVTIYSPGQNGAYTKVYDALLVNQPYPNGSSGVWLAGDLDGEGRTDLFQFWKNDSSGQVGLTIYSPSAGDKYQPVWTKDNMGPTWAGSDQWLTGRLADGRTLFFQVQTTGAHVGLVVYKPSANNAWGPDRPGPQPGYYALSNPDTGEGTGAEAWLTGDMNGDGTSELFQLWDNDGKLGLVIYTARADGAYAPSPDSTSNLGQGAGAVAWLTGDMTGDGKTDIFQFWDNADVGHKLGLIVYSPQASGAYATAWATSDLGQGVGGVAWLPLARRDGGKSDLLQLFDNNNALGMILYTPSAPGYKMGGYVANLGEGPGAIAWFTTEISD